MIRNIIFDWSGTLVDDLPAVLKASNFVLAQAGRPEMSLDTFRAEFSLPFTKFYDRHTPDVPMPQLEKWFHASFRGAQDSVRELPHARDFLKFCRARKIRTFLLSTVHADYFKVQCGVTGFDVFLDRPYTDVWDKREKIHEILAENNLKPAETMFIGDMEHDIETARHGGVYSCAVLTGYNTLEQLRAASPDLIVEHLAELRGLLEQNNLHFAPLLGNNAEAHPPLATVGALIFNRADEALMIRTHKWSDLWGIPGGKIKWGETSEAALRREIKEETNLTVQAIRFVLVQDCIHSKEFYRDAHFVLLNYTCRCAGKPKVILNEEGREFRWLPLAAAKKLSLNTPTKILLNAVLGKNSEGRAMRVPKLKHSGTCATPPSGRK
ncbi:MAG TPA: NUDIX domain-containing protein [Candidatus Limnocylindrales bacterium]|nr:NUDIX domain-containing protein [Candidatus Limnocylindrales bacterium]